MSFKTKPLKSSQDKVLLINEDYNNICSTPQSLNIADKHSPFSKPREFQLNGKDHRNKSSSNNDHNDSHSNDQQISLNINDRSSRLIFWSILILIVSVAEINFTLSMRIFYKTYKTKFNEATDPNPYGGTKFYDFLSVSSNVFLFIASTLILLGLGHKSFVPKVITCTMFTIGAIGHLSHDIWGIHLYCIDDPDNSNINNDNAFCRLSFMGSDLYLILFILYFVMDVMKSIGDKIRIRFFVNAMLLSSIGFINAGNSYHDDKSFEKDTALVFISTIVASGYLIIALITLTVFITFTLTFCSYILVMSEAGDGITCDPSKIVRKGMGLCMLIAIGMVLASPYIFIFVTGAVDEIGTPPIHSLVYYLVGAVLFVYDLQYVK